MKRLNLLLIALLLCAAIPLSAQDVPSATLVILGQPATEGDTVRLNAAIQGADSWRFADLTAANFQIGEPNANLQVETERSANLTVAVLVNLSFGSDLIEMQNTLRAWFNGYFRSGDRAIFTLITAGEPQVAVVTSASEALALIDGLTLSSGYEALATPLTTALARLQNERAENPDQPVVGLFVSSFLNQASDVQAAQSWADSGIALNVIQVHRFRDDWTDEFRQLASDARGIFVNNKDAAYIQAGPPVTAVSSLRAQYDAMDATRTVYTLRYSPRRLDLTANPDVTLSARIGAQSTLSASFQYNREFSAPEITLSGLAQAPERRPSRQDGAVIFDLDNLDLKADVRFPDGIERPLTSLVFEVALQNPDGTSGETLQSILIDAPEPDAFGQYPLSWDLSAFTTPGIVQPVLLTISASDALGLTGSVQIPSQVTIAALPPLPTPTSTFTPTPTATATATITPSPTATATAEPIVAFIPGALEGDPALLTLVREPDTTIRWLIGVIGALLLLATLLLLRLSRANNRAKEALVMAREYAASTPPPTIVADGVMASDAPSEGSIEVTAEQTGDDIKVVGRLVVVDGYSEPEIVIDHAEFTIGRSTDAGNHLVIDEPFISPRHCTISYRGGRFLIRDLGSKNGTFLNGERLPADRDVIAPVGSEVGITRSISTELWDPFTKVEIRRGNRATQETHGNLSTVGRMTTGYSTMGTMDDDPVDDGYSPI
jgi:hypothetical protein